MKLAPSGSTGPQDGLRSPAYFLLGHATELAFKSRLARLSLDDCPRSHDLRRLFSDSRNFRETREFVLNFREATRRNYVSEIEMR